MASLTRSFAALRVRAPRALAHRTYADGPSKEASTVLIDAAGPSSPEASTSTSSSPSISDVAGTAPSSSPIIPESADPANTGRAPTPSALPAKYPRGMTAWGPTKNYDQTPADVQADADRPLSQQILPMQPVPLPPWHTGPQDVWTINYPRPVFPNTAPEDYPNTIGGDSAKKRMRALSAISGLTQNELRDLRRCTVEMKYVVNMTTKGKMRSLLAYVLVGDPKKGMLGLGRGRGTAGPKAIEAAFYDAVLNMDAVDRYEGRTLWGQGKELETKFASTKVSLRARPPGHGLQVPVSVHRVLSACGIRDASASIYGSTHKINVVKAVIQLLHGGANPPGFGDGAGGQAKRDNKGSAMRSRDEIQRSRGRYGVDVGLTG